MTRLTMMAGYLLCNRPAASLGPGLQLRRSYAEHVRLTAHLVIGPSGRSGSAVADVCAARESLDRDA
jgi:hypothetical protein